MVRHKKTIFLAMLIGLMVLPWEVFAASTTKQQHAAVGEGCAASGVNLTAMDGESKAIGSLSFAMGFKAELATGGSIAMADRLRCSIKAEYFYAGQFLS